MADGSQYKTIMDYADEGMSAVQKRVGATKSWVGGLSTKSKIGAGAIGGLGLVGLAFSGHDDNYNTIEGLRHGGFAEGIRKQYTDFGSGYRGLPESLMGVPIDRRILDYRADVTSDKEEYKSVLADIKRKQDKQLQSLGDFRSGDYTGEGQIDLSRFNMEVEDADTLILQRKGLFSGKDIQVRLAGIDAPETGGHSGDPLDAVRYEQDQPLGDKASEVLRNLVSQQKSLSLNIDGEKTYGRYVGDLQGDNGSLNVELARQGAVAGLPFGDAKDDLVSRRTVSAAENQAQATGTGMWGLARYQAIDKVQETVGQSITFNTLSRVDKLASNLNLAAYSSFIEGMGTEERSLTNKEEHIAERLGYALRKTHGPRKRAYNKFDGLHPGSEGMGAEAIRKHSDFGSGWQNGLAVIFGDKQDYARSGYETYGEFDRARTYESEKKINRILGKKTPDRGQEQTTGGKIFSVLQRFSRYQNGNGQKFSGMPNSGTMAARTRGELTEFKEDFASRWDKFSNLAMKMMDGAEDLAFRKARRNAKDLGLLGEGMSAPARLMEGTYKGQKFKFARKIGDFGDEEVSAQIASSASNAPSVYGYGLNKDKKKYLDMELFEGELLAEMDPSRISSLEGKITSTIDDIHKTGYTHGDTHLGNMFLVDNAGKQEIGMIDFGNAKRLSGSNAQELIKKDITSAKGYITSRSSAKSVSNEIQYVDSMDDPFAADPFASAPPMPKRSSIQDKLAQTAQQSVGSGLRSAHKGGRGHTRSSSSTKYNF